jgi:hypothetical protein
MMEGSVEARAQFLGRRRGVAARAGDEEDLGRRVGAQLVGDGLDDVLVADLGAGVDACAGKRGEGEDEAALGAFAAGADVAGPAVEEAVVGGGDDADLGLGFGRIERGRGGDDPLDRGFVLEGAAAGGGPPSRR